MQPSSLDLSTITYVATMTPPTGSSDVARSLSNGTGSFSFTYLAAGSWSLLIRAYADDGTTVVGESASTTVNVTGGSTINKNLDLSPPAGAGDLSLSFDWTTAYAALSTTATYSPTVSLTPITTSGSSTDTVSLSDTDASATTGTYSSTGLDTGFYRLLASLTAPGGTSAAWTTREIVYIYSGATTAGTLTVSSLSSVPDDFSSVTAGWKYDATTSLYDLVIINWYGGAGATSFGIDREVASSAFGSADWGTIGTVTLDYATVSTSSALGYVDSGLDQSKYYRYRVWGRNSYGNCPNPYVVALSSSSLASPTTVLSSPSDLSFSLSGDASLVSTDSTAHNYGFSGSVTTSGSSTSLVSGDSGSVLSSVAWYVDGTAASSYGSGVSVSGSGAAQVLEIVPFSLSYGAGTYRISCVIAYAGYSYSASMDVAVTTLAQGSVKWTYTMNAAAALSNPTIAPDGTVYIASTDWKLFAINPDGTKKWYYTTGNSTQNSNPAIASDGTVYIGSMDYKLHAISVDGTKKWTYETGGYIMASPAIASDGTIYVGSEDSKFYAINPDGTLKWTYSAGYAVDATPAIASDGTIYFSCSRLCAINPDGTSKWSFEGSGSIYASPAIASDGTIYVGSSTDYKFYAINPDGTLKWFYTIGNFMQHSPAIASDGTIYLCSADHKIYAINPDGTLKWYFETGDTIQSSPAIAADGTVYVSSYDCKLYALRPDGTLKWSYTAGGYIGNSSPAIASDGTIYFGSNDNKLYAIVGYAGLATSGWPMFGKNLRHTGNIKD